MAWRKKYSRRRITAAGRMTVAAAAAAADRTRITILGGGTGGVRRRTDGEPSRARARGRGLIPELSEASSNPSSARCAVASTSSAVEGTQTMRGRDHARGRLRSHRRKMKPARKTLPRQSRGVGRADDRRFESGAASGLPSAAALSSKARKKTAKIR